ncbi:MAG: DNA internalization-related competence protein ComEC/Rec2 [Eubacteriales bacterium]
MKRIPLYFLLTALMAIFFYKIGYYIIFYSLFMIAFFLIKRSTIRKWMIVLFLFFILVTFRMELLWNHTHSSLEENSGDVYCGEIVSYPTYQENSVQFVLQLKDQKEKVQATIYNNTHEYYYGDTILCSGKIQAPEGRRNPGGFNYKEYLKSKNIHYIFIINNTSIKLQDTENAGALSNFILSMRKKLVLTINTYFGQDQADFLRGITLGEKSLDMEIRNNFNQLGVSHILAVSGLHIGFIYMLLHKLSQLLKWPKSIEFVFTGILLYLYSFIVGFSISVIRASVMLSVLLFSHMIHKKYDTLNVLCLLGSIFLCINPFTLFTVGFQLSFGCVLAITIIFPLLDHKLVVKNKILNYIKSLVFMTLSVQIGTIPLLLFHFQNISIIATLANIIVVPIVGLIITLFIITMLLLIILGLNPIFLYNTINILINIIFAVTHIFGKISYFNLNLSPLSFHFLVFYYIFMLMLMGYLYMFQENNKRIVQWILLLNMVSMLLLTFLPHPLIVTVFDVGQGDSILIETPQKKAILIDGGGVKDYSVGDNILKKALLYKNIHTLDLVICTHSHEDHLLGILEIADDISIRGIVINCLEEQGYNALIKTCEAYSIPIISNDKIEVNLSPEVSLQFLYPEPSMTYIDENNSSVVAKLEYEETSFLFTGDMEEEGEKILLQGNKDLKSDVIKIGHHGSNTSSSEEFINKVHPNYAIISVGKNNFFGHPSQEVIQRLEQNGIEIYRTDASGAIEIISNGSSIEIKGYDTKGE